MELCNEDGKCQSEMLRDLIETLCEDCNENGEATPQDPEIEVEDTPEIETVGPIMAHGKVLDDYGNVIGTF